MSTLDRYILNAFSRNLALVLLILISLYSLIEFLENVDDFIEYHAAIKYYLLYPLFHLPVIITNTLPMAVLLATFATIGGFSRSNQLTAMLCGGISFRRISRPLFLAGLLLALIVLLAISGWFPGPLTNQITSSARRSRAKLHSKTLSKDIYFRDGNRIISVNHAFPAKGVVLGLTIVEFNDHFMPVKRIQAEEARHTINGQWMLHNVVVWEFVPETRAVASFTQQAELPLDLRREPSEMLQLLDRPEDLTVNELLRLTKKLQSEGYNATAYQVEAHVRLAKAAIPIIMVLIGIPFSLQRGRNSSFSFGIVVSLAVFVVYFLLYAIFAVFGAVAVLPPFVAARAADLLMALIGSWFFLRVQC